MNTQIVTIEDAQARLAELLNLAQANAEEFFVMSKDEIFKAYSVKLFW